MYLYGKKEVINYEKFVKLQEFGPSRVLIIYVNFTIDRNIFVYQLYDYLIEC